MSHRKFTPNVNVRRILSGALSALLVAASLTVIASTAPAVVLPSAVADAPSTQPAPVSVYTEDFENGLTSAQTNVIQSYAGLSTSYTTDAAWQSNCDGVIISGALADITSNAGMAANNNGCNANSAWYIFWNELKVMARAMQNWRTSVTNGTAFPSTNPSNGNHMVSAYTLTQGGATLPTPNLVVLKTTNSLPVSAGKFYSLSLDTLFESCDLSQPAINFYLGSTLLNPSPLNPCATGTKITYPSPNNISGNAGSTRDAYVQQLISNPIILGSAGSYTLQVNNTQTSSNGNDGGFDNFQLLDVTPSLGVAYQYSSTPLHSVETLTYTVENTTDNYAKPGFSFNQTLPSGVVRSGSTVGGTCTNTANTAATTATVTGSTSLAVAGSLPAGTSCTIVINVTSSGTAAVGTTYTSAIADFTNLVGIKTDSNLPSSTKFTTVGAVNDTASVNEGSTVAIDVKANDVPSASSPTNPSGALAASPTLPSSTSANGGTLSVSAGKVNYTPPANFSGNDTFNYQICDQTPTTPNCAIATVTVTVSALFTDGPASTGITTPQNTQKVSTLAQLVSTNGAALNPALVTQAAAPTHGSISINTTTGAVTYTPTNGYSGSDSYQVQVCDTSLPTAQCHTVTIPVTVGPNVVDAVNDGVIPTTVGATINTNVRANDTTSTGTALANPVAVSATSAHGNAVTVNGDGTIKYVASTGFSGTDTYTYTLCDTSTPTPFCDATPATVTLLVNAVFTNGPAASGVSTAQNTAIISPLASIVSTTGSALNPAAVTQVTAPTHGSISINSTTGAVTYTPTPGYTGNDSYQVQVCDTSTGTPQCTTVTIPVTVGPNVVDAVNDGPVTTTVGSTLNANVRSNDTTTTGTPLAKPVLVSGTSTHGNSVTVKSDGTVDYVAAPGFSGTDTFSYTLCDTSTPTPFCDATPAVVTVVVGNGFITPDGPGTVGTPALAGNTGQAHGTTPHDTAIPFPLSSIVTVTGSPLDPTKVTQVTGPTHGSIAIDPTTGQIVYTPTTTYTGTDTFTVNVCDTSVPSQCYNVTVTVTVGANVVTAVNDSATVNAGSSVTTTVKANDTVSSPTTPLVTLPTVTTAATHGTTTVLAGGTIQYTPNANFSGTDTYGYQICDTTTPTPVCSTATVSVLVNSIYTPTGFTTPQNTAKVSALTSLVATNGSPLNPTTVTQITAPSHGALSINATTGAVTYTPTTTYSGNDSYQISVCDTSTPTPQCHTVTIPVTVGVNVVTAVPDTATVVAGQSVTTNVKANDTVSVVTTPLALLPTVTTPAVHGTTHVDSSGTITYTAVAGYSGTDTYGYTICDTTTITPVCAATVVTVTINNGFITPGGPGVPGTPDVPGGTGSATGNTPQNSALPFPLSSLITVAGSPIDPTTITQVGTAPNGGTISINTTTGGVTYTPNPGYTGPDSFVLHMCDTATPSQCYNVTVSVVVGPNIVVAVDDTRTDTINTPLEIDVINNDTSQTGQPLDPDSVTVISNPSNGTVTVSPKPHAMGSTRGFASAASAAGPAWGSIVYTPNTGYIGTDTFRYRVCDTSHPTPVCSTATVNVTISLSLVTLAFTGSQGPEVIILIAGGALLVGIILLLVRRRGRDRDSRAQR